MADVHIPNPLDPDPDDVAWEKAFDERRKEEDEANAEDVEAARAEVEAWERKLGLDE